MAEFFAGKDWQTFLQILPTIPFETWETVWSTVVATLLALVIGLPLGVLLVTGEPNGIRPLPKWVMALLNGLINLLRSVPFLILMIIVIPLSRLIVGTSIGTVASIVPLVIASFPFVSRLIETSIREVDPGVIEAAQSMGATPLQIITKVMVPESMPSLVANITIAATTIMGYGAMAGIIGGGGLGKIAINYGYYRFNVVLEFFATALLVVLVQILQTAGTKLAVKCDCFYDKKSSRTLKVRELLFFNGCAVHCPPLGGRLSLYYSFFTASISVSTFSALVAQLVQMRTAVWVLSGLPIWVMAKSLLRASCHSSGSTKNCWFV